MPDKEKKGLAPTSKFLNTPVPPPAIWQPDGTYMEEPGLMRNDGSRVWRPGVTDIPKSYHPYGEPEGMMEKLIKNYGTGKNFVEGDNVYLEQYLHPDKDIIPKQPLRPTQLSRMPNMEFRHVAKEPSGGSPNIDGLGQVRMSLNNKDYNSVYDVWDFNTDADLFRGQATPRDNSLIHDAKNYLAKKVLQNVGTPYAVYERYPKDSWTAQFEPTSKEISHAQPPGGYDDYEPPKNKVKK